MKKRMTPLIIFLLIMVTLPPITALNYPLLIDAGTGSSSNSSGVWNNNYRIVMLFNNNTNDNSSGARHGTFTGISASTATYNTLDSDVGIEINGSGSNGDYVSWTSIGLTGAQTIEIAWAQYGKESSGKQMLWSAGTLGVGKSIFWEIRNNASGFTPDGFLLNFYGAAGVPKVASINPSEKIDYTNKNYACLDYNGGWNFDSNSTDFNFRGINQTESMTATADLKNVMEDTNYRLGYSLENERSMFGTVYWFRISNVSRGEKYCEEAGLNYHITEGYGNIVSCTSSYCTINTSNISIDTPYLINGSNGFMGGTGNTKQLVWTRKTDTTSTLYLINHNTDAYYLTDSAPVITPTIIFNANTTPDLTIKYNETEKYLYVSITVTNFEATNTTINLRNSTGGIISITGATNLSYNFSGIGNDYYYFNATSQNSTTRINTTSRTTTIYGIEINLAIQNSTGTKRYINSTYSATIYPSGAVSISSYNISVLNNAISQNFTINSATTNTTYNYDSYAQNLTTKQYYLQIESLDNRSNKKSNTATFNLTSNAEVNITAKYIYDNTTISNYTINLTDENTGTIETQNSNNNRTNFNIIKGNKYTINFNSQGYAYTNSTNQTFNQTFQNYTFQAYTTNSVRLYAYDEVTLSLITSTLTIIFSGATEQTYNTSTGFLYIDNLTDGSWTIKLSGGNYTLKSYIITVANGSSQELDAYLSTSILTSIFAILNYDSGAVLPGATFTQNRLINGTWTVVDSKTSDITGRVQILYIANVKYQFYVSLTGYDTNIFYLDPVIFSTYNVRLTKVTTLSPTNTPAYQGVSISYTISNNSFQNNAQNNFVWIISSAIGSLEKYNLSIFYPTGSIINKGILALGEQFNNTFLINATSRAKVNITYCYKSTTSSPKCFYIPFTINGAYTNTSFLNNKDNTYGMGLIERALIVTIMVIIVAGTIGMFAGAIPAVLVALLLYGFFVTVGFINIWLTLPGLLIGFFFILRGGNQT